MTTKHSSKKDDEGTKSGVSHKADSVPATNSWMVTSIVLGILLLVSLLANAVFATLLVIASPEVVAPAQPAAPAQPQAPQEPPGPIAVEVGDSPFIGDSDAPVTIVYFSDFQCSFCGRFHAEVFPQLKSDYIDTGLVRFAYKDFPLSFHPRAIPSAIAARCVREQLGDEGFFSMKDRIFSSQQDLSDTRLRSHAQTLGVDIDEWNTCFADETGSQEQAIREEFLYAQSIGVSGTPTLFINGVRVVGLQPALISQTIEAALD